MKFNPKEFLHGGDYNPDQWLNRPDILAEDVRLMPLAHVNTMSVGIFAWTALEPEEHVYRFDWLDQTFDRLHAAGMKVILATPGGARPPWMAQKYPEVMRMGADRQRPRFGGRHNHCPSSPVYRAKCVEMNTLLARRYGSHPALVMWHVNNEYLGNCYCPKCEEGFREWLRRKYGSLDALNSAWWTDFWSMRFNDWSQIEAPAPNGQMTLDMLRIDYKRFQSDLAIDFFKTEAAPLREITPGIPVSTNFHLGGFFDFNAWDFARAVDVVSWDSYPFWHQDRTAALLPLTAGARRGEDDGSGLSIQSEYRTAIEAAALFDMMRSLKNQPFLMMESAPGMAQWFLVPSQKEPGLQMLSSLQAVAHGSQSVMYFQWRKGRGNSEKFHGAIVDHVGHEHTRVFREVAETGMLLEQLQPLIDTEVRAEVALVYDPDNTFALEIINGIHNTLFCRNPSGYWSEVVEYYRALVEVGVSVDFVAPDGDFSRYKVVVAPVWYMISNEDGRKAAAFVRQGGTLLVTYWSGIVNKYDQCHLGGFPGPLRDITGVWVEEYSGLADHRSVEVEFNADVVEGVRSRATIRLVQEGLQLKNAQALAFFKTGRYTDMPAVTKNQFGKGWGWYLGVKLPHPHLRAFLKHLLGRAGVMPIHGMNVPSGVYMARRCSEEREYLFVMNFTDVGKIVQTSGASFYLLPEQTVVHDQLNIPAFCFAVLTSTR